MKSAQRTDYRGIYDGLSRCPSGGDRVGQDRRRETGQGPKGMLSGGACENRFCEQKLLGL